MNRSLFAHALLAAFGSVVAALARSEEAPATLERVVVTAPLPAEPALGASNASDGDIAARKVATSDTSRLLEGIPGVSVNSAGGVSGLPSVHGLADDRLRVQVNGMDLMPACPNHMNSALSYIDPTRVAAATVYAGIAPVSVGGDSVGGTIQVTSAAPEFVDPARGARIEARSGAFYRSNGDAWGANLGASYVGRALNLSFDGSNARSRDYLAGGAFKPAAFGAQSGNWLAGDVVGSSSYQSNNDDFSLALREGQQLLRVGVSQQDIPFEGFPNQRMDMTANHGTQAQAQYEGLFAWGRLEGRLYWQETHHMMNMGPDRYSYGPIGMPMDTMARTSGARLQANVRLNGTDLLRLGAESQAYRLNDWWPPAGGAMGPLTFWNIDDGRRDRVDVFGEWEGREGERWTALLGVRADRVDMNAGPVQGYSGGAMWAQDGGAFDAIDRSRSDLNWNLTALARYEATETQAYEMGVARKSRSPNLYQRYAWSTQPMAMLMNNFVGDGNGYVGNPGLRPEVADTASVGGSWRGADSGNWNAKFTAYLTRIHDYIDAQRCDFGQCGGQPNVEATASFVNLQYVNQSAQLAGFDASGQVALGHSAALGAWNASGVLGYVRGTNRATGDGLYHVMPVNAKLDLVNALAAWTSTADLQWVGAKTRVSQVRDEATTPAYALLNLRSNRQWRAGRWQWRLDVAVENAFNRLYSLPLGGAYLGQGATMGITGAPWGYSVPGTGRSWNTALSLHF